jgi:hypothetical protein
MFPLPKVNAISPAIMPATATHIVLALATLGDATQIGLFLFMLLRPRWPKQVSNDCHCHRHYPVTFANVNEPLVVKSGRCLISPRLSMCLLLSLWPKLGFSFVLSTNITTREGRRSFFPIIGAVIPWIVRKTSNPESITEIPLPAPAGCTQG